jgi:hypothetical protein
MCWIENGGTILGVGHIASGLSNAGFLSGCPISTDTIGTIASDCGGRSGATARAECVIDRIRANVDREDGNVCRHHARCFDLIYSEMNLNSTRENMMVGLSGHSYNIVPTTGGGRYYADSYNNILFWCPAGTP